MPAGRSGRQGQNITEYLILVTGVLVVVILAVSKGGFFTKGVEKSINMMFDSVEDMATVQCLGTLDDVNGQWSGWSSWGPCASCTQIRTRTCTNPAPKCGGSACTLTDNSKGLLETEAQACYSGSWTVGSCGVCTGYCGSTAGTCTQAVTCNGGCCDPSSQPASVIFCTKAPYPDVWSALGFGSCSVSCDAGISSQTVTCSGMCCDAVLKPPTRRACTDGCCAKDLYIGRDIVNNVDFTGTFGPAANGASVTLTCPSGYGGTPTRTCTATASGACTGNDTYSPPASCYTIAWGGLSGECQPADCSPWTTDIGMGVSGTFPNALHGDTAYADCAAFDARYQGTSTADCWLGAWQNLAQGCRPADCTASWTTDIGSGVTGTFPPTTHGTTESLSCSAIDSRYQGTSTATCDYGSWINLTQGCSPASCVDEIFMDPNSFVTGTFPASPHGTPQTLDCGIIDSRYTGTFSRTCDYGRWINPVGGCAAQSCPAWTTNVGGVNITFAAAAHGVTQPQNCSDFDNTYTGTVNAECSFGNWINLTGGCTAFQCVNPISPSNATMCAGDNTGLTADTSWSVVNNGGCTAQKCEYECNSGFTKSGNDCVGAVCQGVNPDSLRVARPCPGDDPPAVNTQRTLPSTGCSSPTGSAPKCEYYCPSSWNYVYYNGSCCYLGCGSLCGTQTICGQSVNCGLCCGNGALDGTEQCDGSSYRCSLFWFGCISACNQWKAQKFDGGGNVSCNQVDCTVNTSMCCTAVNGTWGGSWVNVGGCGTYQTCVQRQQQQTCVGASCGGTCSLPYPEQYVACSGACCPSGRCESGENCDTCPADCGVCQCAVGYYNAPGCPSNYFWTIP